MKICLACTCGAVWKGIMPEDACAAVKEEWAKVHSGPGHEPCTTQQAARRRQAEEAKEMKLKERT